ncbi:MAG: zinc ribbon domain-containing protein, partial [Chloroflexota bacterium]|nr:zinc ribbon domain-containing protein [Chloroflexota bacterium]
MNEWTNERMNTCPQCNAQNRDAAQFCAQCAQPLRQTCPQCGAHNPARSRFCNQCGAALQSTSPQPQPPTYPPAATGTGMLPSQT